MNHGNTIRFHPLIWPTWLGAGVLAVGSNPLHNVLILLAATLVALVCRTDSPVGRALGLFIRIGLVLIVVRVTLSCVAVGGYTFGATPLGRLPVLQLPWWLGGLALGGPFTLEMMMLGLTSGVRLLTLLAIFGAFNATVDHYGLLRRMPGFLRGAGLAITVALAFVPQTINQLAAIREAQQVRGHRFRTWRDTLPLLAPLISGGLERSLQLAEAMDSRGYGAQRPGVNRRPAFEQLTTVLGLTLASIGLFALFYQPEPWVGITILAVAALVMTWVARSLQRATRHSRYLRDRWRPRDLSMLGGMMLLLACTMTAHRVAATTLVYVPLPRATLPAFDIWSIVLAVLLTFPALITIGIEERLRRTLGVADAHARS